LARMLNGPNSYSSFLPQQGCSLERKVDGSEPLPATLKDPKSLHHSSSGTSGLPAIHSWRFRRSAALISRVRTLSSSFLLFQAGRFLQFRVGINPQIAHQRPMPQSASIVREPFCRWVRIGIVRRRVPDSYRRVWRSRREIVTSCARYLVSRLWRHSSGWLLA
jgi:hypothetical protein